MERLKVHGLSKQYPGGQEAVRDVSFALEDGSCVALLGPNGAGKTTTLHMLSGLLHPTSGEIAFQGGSKNADIRQFIGFLPQHPSFYEWMSGFEFLLYVGRLAHLSKQEAATRARALLEQVGLQDDQDRRIGGYSGGMKQRLGIAQAMIHRPSLLMLDEPVSALDPIGRREVLDMMKTMKRDTTILFSTHVLNDAEAVSDHVMIMHRGEILIDQSLQALRNDHRQPIVMLRGDGDLQPYLQEWERWPWVQEVTFDGYTAKVMVDDLEHAKKYILKEIVEQGIPIQKYEVGFSTLEEMFLKVVQS